MRRHWSRSESLSPPRHSGSERQKPLYCGTRALRNIPGQCSGSENRHRPNSPARGPRSDLLVDGVVYDTTGLFSSSWHSEIYLTSFFAALKMSFSGPDPVGITSYYGV